MRGVGRGHEMSHSVSARGSGVSRQYSAHRSAEMRYILHLSTWPPTTSAARTLAAARARSCARQRGLTLRALADAVGALAAVPDGRRGRTRQHLGPPAGRPRAARSTSPPRTCSRPDRDDLAAARHRAARPARRRQDDDRPPPRPAAAAAASSSSTSEIEAARRSGARRRLLPARRGLLPPPRARGARRGPRRATSRRSSPPAAAWSRRPRPMPCSAAHATTVWLKARPVDYWNRVLGRAIGARSTSTLTPARRCATSSRGASRSTPAPTSPSTLRGLSVAADARRSRSQPAADDPTVVRRRGYWRAGVPA